MEVKDALRYKTWAVVGASPKQEKFGYKIFRCLLDHGYKVYPIHPTAKEIDGFACYASLFDLPEVPEIVNFVVGEKLGLKTVDDCAKLGIKHIWLQPGADTPQVVQAAENAGIDVIEDCVLVQLKK